MKKDGIFFKFIFSFLLSAAFSVLTPAAAAEPNREPLIVSGEALRKNFVKLLSQGAQKDE